MELGTIMLLSFICAICRSIIFKKRDIKWWKSFVPGYNKYLLGKLVQDKKLAIANAIAHTFFWLYFWACFGYELWIISNYAVGIQNPINGVEQSVVQVAVPENVANIAIWSKYILIAVALVTLILWCMMMWKFTIKHKRNPWWIVLWAALPVIPYIYFANISDVVSIDGKRYSIQKVEIKQ